MKQITEYIQTLKSQSFIGWSEDEKSGYMTAIVSIQEKITHINNEQPTKIISTDLQEEIEWVRRQHKFSILLEDGDSHKWERVLGSLLELLNQTK